MDWDFPYCSRRAPVFACNVVATSHTLATQAGLEMLRRGGNAVDAALAAAITLTVVEPTGNGLGSDVFCILWDGDRLHGLNGSGRSPAGWAEDKFAGCDEIGIGPDSITVPGAVDAWVQLSRRFGALPFADLFAPSIRYAQRGFAVTPAVQDRWEAATQTYSEYAGFYTAFMPNGRAPRVGELFAYPAQAETLAELARSHGESFYRGGLGRRMVEYLNQHGCELSLEDLSAHESTWVDPIGIDYEGVTALELPPNGQGVAALIALGILRHLGLGEHPVDSADSVHLQMEATKLGLHLAKLHVADPAHMRITVESLLDEDRLRRYADEIELGRARELTPLSTDGGTVYLTTADENGMMVSFIQSNYHGFGSGIVVPDAGISLHNRGAGFTLETGHPNEAAAGKRPFHTIIPGFVMRGAEPVMSYGVMGAHMQAQGHVQMLSRIFTYGQNPQAASDAPRWYLQEDGSIVFEKGTDEEIVRDLVETRGHRLSMDPPPFSFGGAQLIYRLDNGWYCGASDHRKDGQAAGY